MNATPRDSDPARFPPAVGDPVSSLWRRLRRGVRLVRRQADWDRFAGEGWGERIMSVPLTDREHRKQGRSIGRKVFTDGRDELRVYLKRHHCLPRLRGLLATLWPGSRVVAGASGVAASVLGEGGRVPGPATGRGRAVRRAVGPA